MFAKKSKKPTKQELQQLKNTLVAHTDLYIKSCENNLKTATDGRQKQALEIQLSYFKSIKNLFDYA